MKLHVRLLVATLAVAASTACLVAQDSDKPRQRPPGGPDGQQQRPPIAPLVAALDANHDGVIDATELDNAAVALRKLDKNNDGKLTREELRPPRPQDGEFRGPRGEGRGPRQGRPPGGPGHRPPAPDHEAEPE